jgi:hypothetical protein
MEENIESKYLEAGDLKPRSSFELNSTSRGNTIKVKIYSGDNMEDIDNAMSICVKRFEELKKKYGNE